MSKTSEGLEPEKYSGRKKLPTGNFRWYRARDSSKYVLQMEVYDEGVSIFVPKVYKDIAPRHIMSRGKPYWVDLPKVDETKEGEE